MEINLDGGEKEILKAIGIGGSNIPGKQLLERVNGIEEAEFVSILRGLDDDGLRRRGQTILP